MQVNIKKLNDDAVIPSYAHETDAGMDLTATSKKYDEYGNVVYGTGLAFEIPLGHVGYVFPRSSNSKKDLLLSNSVGVIDSGYRGEVFLRFKKSHDLFKCVDGDARFPHDFKSESYSVGDRIGQIIIMPIPKIEFNVVDELDISDRGQGSFGSTGK